MKLALTYASRTSHTRLARYISELIQQRAKEEEEGGEEEEEGSPEKMEDSRPALRRERSGSRAPGLERALDSATIGKTRSLNMKRVERLGEEGGGGVKALKVVGRGSCNREGDVSRKAPE